MMGAVRAKLDASPEREGQSMHNFHRWVVAASWAGRAGQSQETGMTGSRPASVLSPSSASARRFRAFLDGWRTEPGFRAQVSAYDIKTDSADPQVRTAKRADYAATSVIGASSAPEAVAGAEAVFYVSPPIRRISGARGAAGPGERRVVLRCDSCAPQTKARTAVEVDAAGGRYVDVAVMAPVRPRLHRIRS